MTSRPYGRTARRRRTAPVPAPETAPRENDRAVQDRRITIPSVVMVRQLAEAVDMDAVEFIKHLMRMGVMVTLNQVIDYQTAATAATTLGYAVTPQEVLEEGFAPAPKEMTEEDSSQLQVRPPVVTILGHVDHGKTTLLDAIRQTNVVSQEAGGITQHIGAYQVMYKGNLITFLDTPGHEAFTAMRARGTQVTDIVVLVIAADDGIMPQTVEAVNHAKAANVPILSVTNKIDRPNADPERVKRQLAELNLLPEEWGGETIVVPTSGTTGAGIDELLENLLVLAEVQEIKANPHRPATGVVIEARVDKSRGPMATVLVQQGTLKVGDSVMAGDTCGHVRALISDGGRRVQQALPSTPVELLGLEDLPQAGDSFEVLPDLQKARELLTQARRQREALRQSSPSLSLEELSARIQSGEVQELLLILKCDVQGSIDAVRNALEKVSSAQTQVRILHAAAGTITESDILLAAASQAIIVGFNTRLEPGARSLGEAERVDVRLYDIIYRLTEDIEKALSGLLKHEEREVIDAHALVRAVFNVGSRVRVAGCQVTDGVLTRGSQVRVLRGDAVIHTGTINSLKRFKDDAREVGTGFECGAGVEGFRDLHEGDLLESFHMETH